MSFGPDRRPLAGDPRFFRRTGPHTLAAVADAAMVDGVPADAPPRRMMLRGLAPLQVATQDDVSFCMNQSRLVRALAATKAGAVIVHPNMRDKVPETAVAIVSPNPQVAWTGVANLFHPLPPVAPGIHPTAVVAASAKVDPTAEIGAFAVVGENASIGAYGRIAPFVLVGEGVEIGRHARIGSHASITHALVGDRVYIYPGARIGQDGFGFAITPEGFYTVPQLGRVIIEDDVEVGANSTIDRGAMGDTVVGRGTRIDNLVQIGHNVHIGRFCVLVAQSGMAGSSVLEDQVVLAAQAGVADHVRIGTGTRIGAKAGVISDLPPRSEVLGAPAQPVKAFFKEIAFIRRLVRDGGRASKGAETGAEPDVD